MTLSRLSFFISCHYKLNHMPFYFRAFKCSQVIQKACYNLTLHNQHILFHLRQWNHDSDTECNAGYIILEQKEEFIMFQLQVVGNNKNKNAKSKVQYADNFNQIPQFIVGDIVHGTLTQLYFLLFTSCTRYKWSHTMPKRLLNIHSLNHP